MISAMTSRGVIGTGEGIPWHLPRDSRHLRAFTAGKVMLVGRRTFEEMRGWFTTQTPIVLTRQATYDAGGALIAGDVPEALAAGKRLGATELVVSGGGQVYAAALPYATELILTIVAVDIEGRARFPDFRSGSGWRCDRTERHASDEENAYSMEFQWWVRDHAA